MVSVRDCKIINLPEFTAERGNLSVIDQNTHIPFEIKRIFYLYSMPPEAKRGVHALKVTGEVVIALHGSFETTIDDATDKTSYVLSRPNIGLYIPPGIWRELQNFSPNTVVLALASEPFSKEDYVWDYSNYKRMRKLGQL